MSIRDEISELSLSPDPLTMRSLTDWYKALVRDDLTNEERTYVDKAWAVYVTDLAEKEKLPVGFLGYVIAELAGTELALIQTAEAEARLDTNG